MLKFLKNLFTQKNFPPETEAGTIALEGELIKVYDTESIRTGEIDLSKLSRVYLVTDGEKTPLLYLFDFTEHYIPINFKGFQVVYEYLSNRFEFDDATFFKYVDHAYSIKKKIWTAKHTVNYEILENGPKDQSLGYEIQSPEKEILHWDLTYDQLEQHPAIVFEKSPFGQKIQKFKYPIRIGSILLSDFSSYFDNGRTDAPVLHFYAACSNEEGNDRSYFELKAALLHMLGKSAITGGYERKDQKSCILQSQGMIYTISYTSTNDWAYETGYTIFSVQNNRDYPQLLLNESYESVIQIDASLVLSDSMEMNAEYKRSARIKKRPDEILKQFGTKTVIWRDDLNKMIGFACGNFSQLFSQSELLSVSIQNIIPAKGGGGSYLELNLKNRDYPYAVFTEQYKYFDPFSSSISELLQLEIDIKPEYHDC
ncbi:MAG: hypothetical protein K2P88_00105 [Chitinophagaceae bacterium]|nr:hypothetical protein [Chitinophagaceae bacterium]